MHVVTRPIDKDHMRARRNDGIGVGVGSWALVVAAAGVAAMAAIQHLAASVAQHGGCHPRI